MNAREQRLADAFWPGPLTLVLKMDVTTADEDPLEEGFRAPDSAFVQALMMFMQTPLLVSSANVSGTAPALTVEDARCQLGDQIDLYVDAGPITGGAVSSVVRASGETLEILREDAISAERLREVADP